MRPVFERRRRGKRGLLHLLAYGVRLEVSVEPASLFEHLEPLLPPGWVACEDTEIDARLALLAVGDGYEVTRDGTELVHGGSLELALGVLDAQLRMVVATRAPAGAFVHAGVVSLDGHAIVLPGFSFAGKTTLVRALLEQGAAYLSDEFAVLDEDGRVHPYAKPLSLRAPGTPRADHAKTQETSAASLGARIAADAVPVGLIAALTYRPDSAWSVEPRSGAQGALLLLAHALRGRDDSARVLAIVAGAARDAVVLEGRRGEADGAASALVELMRERYG
jgi:hypothetical protein